MSENITKPTLETLLERMNAIGERMDKGFEAVNIRLDHIEIRLDRIESMAHTTRGEMLSMRADFTELRNSLKQPA
ncbi:MAG: hypothetical protein ABR577_01300 [Pyrinomonadaceae bacterium]